MDHLSLAAVPSIGFGAIGAALVILAMTPLRRRLRDFAHAGRREWRAFATVYWLLVGFLLGSSLLILLGVVDSVPAIWALGAASTVVFWLSSGALWAFYFTWAGRNRPRP
jgi:hypothetical protein